LSEYHELTRQLLRGPAPADPPPAAPPPTPVRWRRAGVVALTLLAAAGAAWWWHASRKAVPQAASAPVDAGAEAVVRQPALATAEAAAPAARPVDAAPPAPNQPAATAPLSSIAELLAAPASPRPRWSRLKTNPAILVIEFPNLHEQGLAMNRLAAMFEKRAAQRERVLSSADLDELMRRSGDTVASFYQGHDYPAAKVARFFTLAEAQHVPLNAQEAQLRALLLDAGLMRRGEDGAYQALGEQAAVSFTGVQPDNPSTPANEMVDRVRREAVLHHELSHGEFFTNAAYRAHCIDFWRKVLNERERRMFRGYLKGLNYNPDDDTLMANETQALLMHTPDSRAFNAADLGISEAALSQLQIRFRAGEPANGLEPGPR
jgi:hypothetical protein